jgi:hypothetical protein
MPTRQRQPKKRPKARKDLETRSGGDLEMKSHQIQPAEEARKAARLTPEADAELKAWIATQQADAKWRKIDPQAWNRAFLLFMQQVAAVEGLRPYEVETRTGVKHQHQRRMKPTADGLGEAHVSLFTAIRWTNGMGFCITRVISRLLDQMPTLLMFCGPLSGV